MEDPPFRLSAGLSSDIPDLQPHLIITSRLGSHVSLDTPHETGRMRSIGPDPADGANKAA